MYAPNIPAVAIRGAYRALPLLDMVTPSENDLVQTALILETLRQKTRQSAGMLRFGLWKKCRSGADVATGLWWLQKLGASEGRTQTGSAAMVLSPATAQVVQAAVNRLKQG